MPSCIVQRMRTADFLTRSTTSWVKLAGRGVGGLMISGGGASAVDSDGCELVGATVVVGVVAGVVGVVVDGAVTGVVPPPIPSVLSVTAVSSGGLSSQTPSATPTTRISTPP